MVQKLINFLANIKRCFYGLYLKKKFTTLKNKTREYKTSNNTSNIQMVFEGSEYEAPIIKSLLERNGIIVYQVNYIMSTIEPWLINSAGYKPAILKVNYENIIAAKKIILEYNENILNLKMQNK